VTCDQAPELAVYVLGALEPAERSAVERHVATCEACRAELADLAGMPGLLARIDRAEVEHIVAAPHPQLDVADDAGLNRLLAASRRADGRDRRGRRRIQLLSVAAALVVLAGAGGTAAAVWGGSGHRAAPITASAGPVHATVRLTGSSTGTAIALDLSGVAPEEHCRLVAVSKTGAVSDAGSWTASYTGWAGIHGVTAIAATDLASLRVVTTAGATLVTIPVNS
jgi:anti-sigma factor ChrR (cupin superfamily)